MRRGGSCRRPSSAHASSKSWWLPGRWSVRRSTTGEVTLFMTMTPPGRRAAVAWVMISLSLPPWPPMKMASGDGPVAGVWAATLLQHREQKSPMRTSMPGAPWRRAFSRMRASHSGRISKATTWRWGKSRRASMETLPVQKPMSQRTRRRGRSRACRVSRRMGIFVIIFSRPSRRAKEASGRPKGREGRGEAGAARKEEDGRAVAVPLPAQSKRQLGRVNSRVEAAARERVVMRSRVG